MIRFHHAAAALALAGMAAALVHCQAFAKLETRRFDPLKDGCALPSTGDARVRVANLVPSAQPTDFCVRPSGGSYARPILRGGGLACPNGYAYAQVSVPFAVPSGTIDVKAIPAGETCSAPATSEANGIPVDASAVVTLARIGGNGQPEQILALPESDRPNPASVRLRFVHAAPGMKPMFLGLADDANLPTDVTSVIGAPIPYGSATSSGTKALLGTVDDHGYLVEVQTPFKFGAAEDGSTNAVLVQAVPGAEATYSLYAVGNPRDLAFPPRGLFCDDDAASPASVVDGGTAPLLANCQLTSLATISVDVFNAGLYGANAPDEANRKPYVYAAIAARTSELMCLVETALQQERDAITAAAAQSGNFKYAYAPTTTLSTPVSDAADAKGNVPPAPTTPSCGGDVPSDKVDAAIACVEKFCSTRPAGDDTGQLSKSTDCISQRCAIQFAPLLSDYPACFDCLIDYMSSYQPFADTRSSCTTDPRPPLAFQGQTPSMILSRYPLTATDTFILPSTNFRRAVLYAQVQLKNTSVDFYCAQLSSAYLDASLPYVGPYDDGDPAHGYDQEALLQTQKLIAWVQKKSGGRPAILAGDWRSSVAASSNGQTTVVDLNPAVQQLLRSTYQHAVAPGWTPQCEFCPSSQNSLNGNDVAPTMLLDVYLSGWPDKATTDESILFNQAVVPTANGNEMLSPYFGLAVRVLRP